jgi:tetratricopeptide (TPR) repeat protein
MTRTSRLRASAGTVALIGALTVALAGCRDSGSGDKYLPRAPGTLTFNKDIAPILFQQCASCHRPGQFAPFSLLTYREAKERAPLIAVAVESRRMPPWLPERGFGEFEGERRLTNVQIGLIKQWVEEGAVEGSPADLPPAPEWAEGWQIGEPDLVVEIPEPYTLHAQGPEVFRNFVIPIPVSDARYVRAVEFRPGNARAVHHAVMMIDRGPTSRRMDEEDPGPGFDGMFSIGEAFSPGGFFLGWTPGQVPSAGDGSMSWRLEPGTDLVLQLHLRPTGQPDTVEAAVGLYFAETPPQRVPALLRLGSQTIDIPAGQKDYTIRDTYVLPVEVEVLGLYPHAHYLGKQMQAFATLPDGTTRRLIQIDDWDFNWQGEYRYKEPILLPAATALSMRYTYDNSASNPRNPSDPPVRVVYGPGSTHEMGDLWIQVLPRDSIELAILNEDFTRKELRALADGFEQLARFNPGDAQARYNLGLALQALGEPDGAIEQYREAVRIRPDYAAAHNNLGSLYESRGEQEEALEHFRRALDAEPDYAQAHYNAGNVLQERGESVAAIEHYRRAIQTDPRYVEAHYNLGNVLMAQGELEEAIAQYGRALEVDAEFAPASYNLGNALQRIGRVDEAILRYRRTLELDPGMAAAHNNLGLALEAQGKPDEAMDQYRRAIESDENLVAAYKNMANALQSQGRLPEALDYLRQALSIDPADAQANYNLALGLQWQGRFEEAVPYLEKIAASRPENADLRHTLGLALLRAGRIGEALQELEQAARLRPGWALPLYTMAWMLATHPSPAIRDPARAIRLAERAAEMSGFQNPLVLDALAAAYASAGRFDRAVPTAERALAVASSAGVADLANGIRGRLELYRTGVPYRDAGLR